MQRMVIRPPPAGPTFMIEVIVIGALGAQVCQAAKIRAACGCDSFQDTPNTSAVCSGKALIMNWVAMPKLPPPPPRHAQYKSGSDPAFACSALAWLSTMLIAEGCRRSGHATSPAVHGHRPSDDRRC